MTQVGSNTSDTVDRTGAVPLRHPGCELPLAYAVEWMKNGVLVTYGRYVTFEDFMRAVLEIHKHPDYAMFKYTIHDMRSVPRMDFAPMDMTFLVAHELGARHTNPGIKAAVVTSNHEIAAMFRQFAHPPQPRAVTFETVEQASAWSDLQHRH